MGKSLLFVFTWICVWIHSVTRIRSSYTWSLYWLTYVYEVCIMYEFPVISIKISPQKIRTENLKHTKKVSGWVPPYKWNFAIIWPRNWKEKHMIPYQHNFSVKNEWLACYLSRLRALNFKCTRTKHIQVILCTCVLYRHTVWW